MRINRPEVEVNIVEGGQNLYAGKVVNPFYFCNLGVHIFDRAGNLKYMVEGSCCQCGVLCSPWPCESCQTVHFEVKSPDGTVLSTLTKVIYYKKLFYLWMRESKKQFLSKKRYK